MKSTKILSLVLGTSVVFGGAVAFAQAQKPAAPAAKTAAPAPAAAAPAAAPTPPAPPKPSKELETFMKPFEGTWKCEVTFAAGTMGPNEVKGKSTAKFKKDMGGFFWKLDYSVPKQKDLMPLTVQVWFGADANNDVTLTSVDSMGGSSLESGKPEADSVTTTGEGFMMGHKVKIRETLWHKDKAGGHTAEVDMGKGWVKMGSEECKK